MFGGKSMAFGGRERGKEGERERLVGNYSFILLLIFLFG